MKKKKNDLLPEARPDVNENTVGIEGGFLAQDPKDPVHVHFGNAAVDTDDALSG